MPRVGDDPMYKLLLERDPLSGATLGSQPTLSRFEPRLETVTLYGETRYAARSWVASDASS
jgi:hypothetical protein